MRTTLQSARPAHRAVSGHKRGRSLGQERSPCPSTFAFPQPRGNVLNSHRTIHDAPASKKSRPNEHLAPSSHDNVHAPHLVRSDGPQCSQKSGMDTGVPVACPSFPPRAPVAGWLPMPPPSWKFPPTQPVMPSDSAQASYRGPEQDQAPDGSFHRSTADGRSYHRSRPSLPSLPASANPSSLQARPPSMPPTPAWSQDESARERSHRVAPPSLTPASWTSGSRSASTVNEMAQSETYRGPEPARTEAYLDIEDTDYWFDESEPLDPHLTLGEVVWRPANVIYTAMPSTWDAAERWAHMSTAKPRFESRQTLSKYVTQDQSTTARNCVPVQQTQDWATVKEDPVFRDLSCTLTESDYVRARAGLVKLPVHKVREARRASVSTPANPRPFVRHRHQASAPPRIEPERETSPAERRPRVRGMTPEPLLSLFHDKQAAMPRIMQNPTQSTVKLAPAFEFRPSSAMSLVNPADVKTFVPSSRSVSPQRLSRPSSPTKIELLKPDLQIPTKPLKMEKPPKFDRDDAQEDILSRLGVTGSPKAVFNVPGPARNPNASPSTGRSPSPDKHFRPGHRAVMSMFDLPTIREDARDRFAEPAAAKMAPTSVMGEISNNIGRSPAVATSKGSTKRRRNESVDLGGSVKRARDGARFGLPVFSPPHEARVCM